jgi:hypothetical protein
MVDEERDGVTRIAARTLAAAARTSIFVVSLEGQPDATQRANRSIQSRIVDGATGLQTLAASARRALFNLIGTGTGVFDRITSSCQAITSTAGHSAIATARPPHQCGRRGAV